MQVLVTCTYIYLPIKYTCTWHPEATCTGDPNLIESPGTFHKASVPGARQEPLQEISPHNRPMTMSRWNSGSGIIVAGTFQCWGLQPNPSQVFAMIETREAIQNLDSILDLEVRKSKLHCGSKQKGNEIKSFAGSRWRFSWPRRPLHLFWGLHRPWLAKVRTSLMLLEGFWWAVFFYFSPNRSEGNTVSQTEFYILQSFKTNHSGTLRLLLLYRRWAMKWSIDLYDWWYICK